jgi:hypothetical protein
MEDISRVEDLKGLSEMRSRLWCGYLNAEFGM